MSSMPPATRLSLNLAPMVDVMMCLLVFFMLATKLVERENSRIDLPQAAAAKDAEKQALGNRFVVNIQAARIPGEVVYLVRETPVTLEEIARRLLDEGRNDPDVNCVIRADRHLPYRHVEAVMAACARAKVRNLTFGAIRTNGRLDE